MNKTEKLQDRPLKEIIAEQQERIEALEVKVKELTRALNHHCENVTRHNIRVGISNRL